MHRPILTATAVVLLAASVSSAQAQDYRVYEPNVTCQTAMANFATKKNDEVVSVNTYIKVTMASLDSRHRESGEFAFMSLMDAKNISRIVGVAKAECTTNPSKTLFNASVDTYIDVRNVEISKLPAR
jgi:hypothetical protein